MMLLYNLLLNVTLLFHPFHVSVCTMHYAEQDQSIQITLKLFADDLEETLNNKTTTQSQQTYIDVLNPKDKAAITAIISTYIGQHLRVSVNGKPVETAFLGYEMEDFAMWCYLEITGIAQIDQMEVENTILTESFDDQTNIVQVDYKGDEKSMKLAIDNPSDVLTF